MECLPEPSTNSSNANRLSATVGFKEGGGVALEMDESVARNVSAAILCFDDPSEVDDEMLNDAMGEMANVLAGMMKAKHGGHLSLQLPKVSTAPSAMRAEGNELPVAVRVDVSSGNIETFAHMKLVPPDAE